MKKILFIVCSLFSLSTISTMCWALPDCVGSFNATTWDNCFGSFKWTSGDYVGDKYVGDFKNGKMHGQGTYTFASGSKYVGQFKDGKNHGYGTYTYANGDKYVGEYKNGMRHGRGTSTFASGSKYVGDFINDKRYGQGIYTYLNGDIYRGGYKDDEKNGHGIYTYADGGKEVGAWENGKLNGYAVIYGADGSIDQEGIFKDDVFQYAQNRSSNSWAIPDCNPSASVWDNCLGTYEWNSGDNKGDKYVGEWKNNEINGQGTYYFLADNNSKGDKYEGEFRNGVFQGQGTYTFSSGHKYTGEFRDGERNGKGISTYYYPHKSAGYKYVGDFKDGKRHGQGTSSWGEGPHKGDKYVGEHRYGKMHGQGTYYWADGRKEVGEFKNGSLNGYAVKYNSDGTILKKGIFKDDVFQYSEKNPSGKNNKKTPKNTVRENTFKRSYNNEPDIFKVASGTGFFVSVDGHIITNQHVIDSCKQVKVHLKGEILDVIKIAEDKANDLALLKVSSKPKHVFPLSNESPYPTQEILVAGYPFGDNISSTLKFTQGIVSSIAGIDNNYSQIQIDAALQPGNSGGPILDDKGNVVGVAVAKLSLKKILKDYGVIPENTNFGVKSSVVKNLLEGNGIILNQPKNLNVSRRELSRVVSSGTVFLSCWMTMAQMEKVKTRKLLFTNFD